ncbi:MAG: alpha/beta hydrolase [Rhizobiaceae bacterium]
MQTETVNREMAGLNVLTATPGSANPGNPPILLVHGAWHGAWCWAETFVPYFAEKGFEVYAIDLRGHGKSPAVKSMRWNRIRDYVDDVEAIAGKLSVPPVVIGHSMGGLVCQHLVCRTDRMAGVGLLATVPSYGVWRATTNIALSRPIDFLKVNLTLSLWPLVSNPVKAKHMFLDADASDEDIRELATNLADESWLGFLDMLIFDLPRKHNREVPMLVVGGEKDTLFSPDSQHHTARFHDCESIIVPNAPHDLMLSKHWQVAAGHFHNWLENLNG